NIMFDTVNYRHLGPLDTYDIDLRTQQNQRGLMFREQGLLNVYVYDYLKRNRATKTAIAYLKEVLTSISRVWDIYSAKLNHSGTVDMHNYVDQDQQSLDQQQR
ncbi:19921_t:CDS:2, partial [Gigaspora rosea]